MPVLVEALLVMLAFVVMLRARDDRDLVFAALLIVGAAFMLCTHARIP